MIHVGLDLSLTNTGCALLVSGEEPVLHAVPSKPIGSTLRERSARLIGAVAQIEGFVEQGQGGSSEPYRIYVEAPIYTRRDGQSNGHQHERSGMWWMVVNELLEMNHAVIEVSPTSVKAFAANHGSATKEMMAAATARAFPHLPLETFRDTDRADALWLAALSEYVENPDAGRVARTAYRDKAASAVPRR